MNRTRIAALTFVCLVAGCGQGDFAGMPDGPIEDRVKFVASGVNFAVPSKLSDHLRFSGARADGRTLILTFDTDLDGSTSESPQALSKLFRPQVCGHRGYRRLIEQGAAIQFEIKRSRYGDGLQPFSIAYCGEDS